MIFPPFSNSTTSREAADESPRCPTCGQLRVTYLRKVNAGMAAALLILYRHTTPDSAHEHLPTLLRRYRWVPPSALGGDPVKLTLWGLIEGLEGEREDGSKRNGFWRITSEGVSFASGLTRIPRNAIVQHGTLLELNGDHVSIHDCIKARFSYEEAIGRTHT